MKTNKPMILIVDDMEINIDILLNLLNIYDLAVAMDGQTALEIVKNANVDLILLDVMMPEMDGYEVCKILKENPKTQEIPIIFLTAKTDEKSIQKAYDTGGIDFITKPFKPKELLERVKRELKLKSLLENLEFMASHDPMTGIYNRRKFFELGELKFLHAKEDLYTIMIDIDRFKDINDAYGHAVGDKVIKAVVSCIKEELDESSCFGRLGGEEFAVLCHIPSSEKSTTKIESIRNLVSNLEIYTDDAEVVTCTISAGISKASPKNKNLDSLLKVADDALYEAKGTGRNRTILRQ